MEPDFGLRPPRVLASETGGLLGLAGWGPFRADCLFLGTVVELPWELESSISDDVLPFGILARIEGEADRGRWRRLVFIPPDPF